LVATYLIGKGTVEASSLSFYEGIKFMKSVGNLIVRAGEFIVGLF
jgi:hypothetical protein